MIGEKILLTIIIPIYNMELYLPQCLMSLQKQKFGSEVEILLIDDGSTDNSFIICKKMENRDPHYHVIHQDNQGVSAARNTGLRYAKGKYIAWVDPDDYITSDWYSTVSRELESCPDMIYFDMYILKNEKTSKRSFAKKSCCLSKYELCKELAVGNRIQSHLWSKIIRRTFFEQSFSSKYSYCEDFAVLHHICWHVKSCRYIHKPLYVYRQVENSIVHNESKILNNYRLGIRLYKQRCRFYKKKNVNVPRDGIYLSMIDYCYEYKKQMGKIASSQQNRFYIKCLSMIRRKCIHIIFSKYLILKNKIKMLIAILP